MHRSLKRKVELIFTADAKKVTAATNLISKKLQRMKDMAKKAFKILAIGAVAGVVAMGLLGKSVLKTGMQFESFRVQLKVLFKSVELAEKKFAWIKKFAMTTPFELPQIVEATIKLKATGLAAETILRDLGDLAAASQKPLEQVVMAISNIASGLTGLGIKQLRLMNINNEMLKEQGITFNTMGRAMESSTEVIAAVQTVIQERFSGMMLEQSKTMQGIITNIKDAWTQIKGIVAEDLMTFIKPKLEYIRDIMFEVIDSGRAARWGKAITLKVKELYNKAKVWIPKIFEMAKAAAEALWSALKPAMKFFADNPNMVKTAVILVVLAKAISMAKTFSAIIGATAIMGAAKAKGFKTMGKAIVGSRIGQGVAGAVGGAAVLASGKIAAGVGVAGKGIAGLIASLGGGAAIAAAIVPVAVAVLGAAAVTGIIYSLTRDEAKKIPYGRTTGGDRLRMPAGGSMLPGREGGFQLVTNEYTEEKKAMIKFNAQLFEAEERAKQKLLDVRTLSASHAQKIWDGMYKNQAKIEQSAFEFSIRHLDDWSKEREAILKKYADIEAKIKGDSAILTKTQDELINNNKRQRDEEMHMAKIVFDEKANKDLNDKRLERLEEYGALEQELKWTQMENALVADDERGQAQLALDKEYYDLRLEIVNDHFLNIIEKMRKLALIDEIIAAKMLKIDKAFMKEKGKIWKGGLNIIWDASKQWARAEDDVGKRLRNNLIQYTIDEVTGVLEAKALEWGAKAIAAAAAQKWDSAALYTAATVAAGAGILGVQAIGTNLMAEDEEDSFADDFGSDFDSGSSGSPRGSGYTTRGPMTVYIQPTLTFSADGGMIIVGDTSLEVAAETIGSIAVTSVKEALETGELSLEGGNF